MLRISAQVRFVMLLGAAVVVPAASAAAQTGPVAGGDNPFADLGLPEVAVTITEDAFEGVPTELAAGRYVLAVTNTLEAEVATETSGAAFLRVPEGMTAAEFVEMIAAEAGSAATAASPADVSAAPEEEGGSGYPDWYYETEIAGGPYVFPGQTGYTVVDLSAGEWVLWGEDPSVPQAPVVVVVTGEAPADQPAPTADVRIEMSDFTFAFDPQLVAGPHVIELANVGEQPHFIFLAQVPDGTTVDDALALFESFEEPESSVPPSASSAPAGLSFEDLTEALSTGDQSAGVTAWYAVDFAAGTYLAACFVTDPETGMPHAMLGMTQIIVIA